MRLLSEKDLKNRGIPYCRQHRNRLIQAGKFPKPVRMSENRIAWIEKEIDEWQHDLIKARDNSTAEAA